MAAHFPDRICDMSPKEKAKHDAMCEAFSKGLLEEQEIAIKHFKQIEKERLQRYRGSEWTDLTPNEKYYRGLT